MSLYCGVCFHDQGVFRLLKGPFGVGNKATMWCSYCQVERHAKTVVSRVCTMPFKETIEPAIYSIAHIISGPELVPV